MMRITELKAGDRVRLLSFGQTAGAYRRRLLLLGITRGIEVEIIRVAPLGCPVQIAVRETALTLRKEEAAQLEWEFV